MTYPALDAHAANESLARFRIIDVREPHEFNGPLGHIARAESIPLGSLPEAVKTANRNASLLLVCRSGARSGKACELLLAQGFGDVTNLAGGMIGWHRGALPVARADVQSFARLLESLVAWLAQVTAASQPQAEASVGAYLSEAGASLTAPTATSVAHALERVFVNLQGDKAPADLDLVIEALHKDLVLL